MDETVDVGWLTSQLREVGYLADRGLAQALALATTLKRAVLLEGDAGVGKTEAARALAAAFDAQLIRLQCYEGLDLYSAAYDWNYGKQLLAIRSAEATHERPPDLYGEEFLIRRPLLASLQAERPRSVVLLIDEIDRADDEFEAYLLEFLSEFAITVPELGRIAAAYPPIVVLTSNRTRDLHDALKRRCFYHWIAHPSPEREVEILRTRLPLVPLPLATDIARAIAQLREGELRKPPGTAEALDWAEAATALGAERLDRRTFGATLGIVLKYPEDIDAAAAIADDLIA
jgi:MoxR-like ATPase